MSTQSCMKARVTYNSRLISSTNPHPLSPLPVKTWNPQSSLTFYLPANKQGWLSTNRRVIFFSKADVCTWRNTTQIGCVKKDYPNLPSWYQICRRRSILSLHGSNMTCFSSIKIPAPVLSNRGCIKTDKMTQHLSSCEEDVAICCTFSLWGAHLTNWFSKPIRFCSGTLASTTLTVRVNDQSFRMTWKGEKGLVLIIFVFHLFLLIRMATPTFHVQL